MRPRYLIALIAVMIVAVGGAVATLGQNHGGAAVMGTATGATPPPNSRVPDSQNPELQAARSTPQSSDGHPGIPPRSDHPAGQAAFTEQDVRAYLEQYPPSLAASSEPAPTITKIEFLSVSQAEKQLQTSLDGHPGDEMVYVVRLQGDFAVPVPPGVAPESGHVGVLVFDGNTGNLLVEGVEDVK
jgi:hypothetical protein